MPTKTLGDWLEQALIEHGKPMGTSLIYSKVQYLSGKAIMSDEGQQAAIRGVLQRDPRFHKVSRGVYELASKTKKPDALPPVPKYLGGQKVDFRRIVTEPFVSGIVVGWQHRSELPGGIGYTIEDETGVRQEGIEEYNVRLPALTKKPDAPPPALTVPDTVPALPAPALPVPAVVEPSRPHMRSTISGPLEIFLPEKFFDAPIAVLEEVWQSYVKKEGDWAYLSPIHASRLKQEIERKKATPAEDYSAPPIFEVVKPATTKEIITDIPEDRAGMSLPDPDLDAIRQFNAPDIDLPVPVIREGPSAGSATQEPLGPGETGKTYTMGPGAVEEVVNEVELRRRLERQKSKARRRFQSPGWTSMIPEEGSRTWFSSEDVSPPTGWRERKWRVSPGWFKSAPKPVGKWRAFPGWFKSYATLAEPEYGREIAQESRVAWLEDKIMEWKERLRKGRVSEAGFRNMTTYLYDQLELVDPYNQLVAERYEEPVKRKEISDGLKIGVALTAGLGIIGALLWKRGQT